MNKKIHIGVIIAVGILIIIPTTSSFNYQEDKQKENKLADSINEIISVINGKCYVDKLEPFGWIIRDIEFTDVWYDGWLHLRILLSNPFKLKLIFTSFPHRINVPLFIGDVHQTFEPGVYKVWGIALGNINWQE